MTRNESAQQQVILAAPAARVPPPRRRGAAGHRHREFRPVDPVLAATALWTAVHGITSLLISLPDFPWPDVDTLVDHVCDIQIFGLSEPAHTQGGTA